MCDISFGFISSSRTERQFSKFSYIKACEENRGSIVVTGKVEKDLKSNVSLKIFFFYLESEYIFKGAEKKEVGKGLVWKGFWHDLFHGKDIDYNVISQKIVYIVVSRLYLGWIRVKRQMNKKKKERFQKYGCSEWKNWFSFSSPFSILIVFVQYGVRQVW